MTRLRKMAALAIDECLRSVPRKQWARIPLVLCTAEPERPGRPARLDQDLFAGIQSELNTAFGGDSLIIPSGRVGVAAALQSARSLLTQRDVPFVLIAAADSLLSGPALRAYERWDRLLTSVNSNGFMPGEGAAAVLVGRDTDPVGPLCCGLGFGMERAHIVSDEPLRADGLTEAIANALADAGCQLHDLNFRVIDAAGEQYYFKEASLAVSRLLRQHLEEFEQWQPAECLGETGAVAGFVCLILAATAMEKDYAPGPAALIHASADCGRRAALVLTSH